MRVRLVPEAEVEIGEAVDWYATRDDYGDLADRFVDEVMRVRHQVGEHPRAWTEIEPGVRKAVLRRFPYSLIYVVLPSEVLILAAAHHSRQPGYWRARRATSASSLREEEE